MIFGLILNEFNFILYWNKEIIPFWADQVNFFSTLHPVNLIVLTKNFEISKNVFFNQT